ncbi:hypothetical protein IMY05_005G0086100 [Salix suchowensis]|nr:hypothetical protein IMY05_005G0086100 [Salix suchowensis]
MSNLLAVYPLQSLSSEKVTSIRALQISGNWLFIVWADSAWDENRETKDRTSCRSIIAIEKTAREQNYCWRQRQEHGLGITFEKQNYQDIQNCKDIPIRLAMFLIKWTWLSKLISSSELESFAIQVLSAPVTALLVGKGAEICI